MKAARNTILVRVHHEETAGGQIIIPEEAKSRHASFEGEVLSIGPEVPHDVKEGNRVIFSRHEGHPVHTSKTETVYSLAPERVLGVIE